MIGSHVRYLADVKKSLDRHLKFEDVEQEFGDLLFSLVNYARYIGVNPETALERTNKKFMNRFQFMEKELQREGISLKGLNLDQMDVYWERAKQKEKKS